MNISIVRAATCEGPTRAPRLTAAARASPLPWRIVNRCTDITVEMIDASVMVVASSRNKPLRGMAGADIARGAATGGAGVISGGELEESNVDLATEFAQMIVTQQAYSANSKVITTADQMTQSLLQITG